MPFSKDDLRPHLQARAAELFAALHDGEIEIGYNEVRHGLTGARVYSLAEHAYYDHATDQGGDVFSMIAIRQEWQLPKDFPMVIEWAATFLHFKEGRALPPAPKIVIKKKDPEEGRQRALRNWEGCLPISGTLAEDYLLMHRHIYLDVWPENVRFQKSAYNHKLEESFPAIVLKLVNAAGNFSGIQRIFLDPVTGNKIGPAKHAKFSQGIIKGSAIRHREQSDRMLIIGEAPEEGLALCELFEDASVWTACGNGLLTELQVKGEFDQITICANNDEPGKEGARTLARRLTDEGYSVKIRIPPDGSNDWNDYLRATKAIAAEAA